MQSPGKIKVQAQQHDPAVWIERFLIFESVEPLIPIREINFRRGVNIIWAVERESANDVIGPADLTGHSAGKTTLCRLLRYCLGEDRFGTEDGQRLIRHNLPAGYVGAHIWLEGKRWAVARPIGTGNRHYASLDLTVEELLGARTRTNEYSTFTAAIEQALLRPLAIRTNPRTGQPIIWKQILAWCTRDQEAHYEDAWAWRSSRSASEPLGFEKPKVDAVFLMRVLLGLVAGDEPAALQALKEREVERDKAKAELEEARKEPEYWDRHLRKVLCDGLHAPPGLPLEADHLFQKDNFVDRLAAFQNETQQSVTQIDLALGKLERESVGLQRDRQDLLGELNDCLRLLSQQEASAKELAAARTEVEQADEDDLTEIWSCPYSKKLVREVECWNLYLTRRQRHTFAFTQATSDLRDSHQLAQRQQAIADLRRETATLTEQTQQNRLALESNKKKHQELRNERDSRIRHTDSLANTLAQLRDWWAVLAGNKTHPRIATLTTALVNREADVQRTHEKSLALLRSHRDGQQRLRDVFNNAVKVVISKNYGGTVNLTEDDLRFAITHGPPLGGEAVNILSVLLADVAALILSIEGSAFLPRLLIHDSPRESDLARHIYWNFLGFIFGLEPPSSREVPAFQYIVTTTTPPPSPMEGKPPLQETLNASQEKGLLFGRFLTAAPELPLLATE